MAAEVISKPEVLTAQELNDTKKKLRKQMRACVTHLKVISRDPSADFNRRIVILFDALVAMFEIEAKERAE